MGWAEDEPCTALMTDDIHRMPAADLLCELTKEIWCWQTLALLDGIVTGTVTNVAVYEKQCRSPFSPDARALYLLQDLNIFWERLKKVDPLASM